MTHILTRQEIANFRDKVKQFAKAYAVNPCIALQGLDFLDAVVYRAVTEKAEQAIDRIEGAAEAIAAAAAEATTVVS